MATWASVFAPRRNLLRYLGIERLFEIGIALAVAMEHQDEGSALIAHVEAIAPSESIGFREPFAMDTLLGSRSIRRAMGHTSGAHRIGLMPMMMASGAPAIAQCIPELPRPAGPIPSCA